MTPIADKTILITGASSGIGAATARALAQAGAQTVLTARDAARLEALAAELPGRPLVLPADLADPQTPARLVEQTLAARGSLDVVILNAGVGLAAPVAELRPEDLEAALAVNLFSPLRLTQAALPALRRARGQVVFVSSVVGLRALPYLSGYAASKAALDRLSEGLRVELRASGVAVTLVRPGTTRTGFSQRRLGQGRERRRFSPRGVPPERVAATILRAVQRRPRVAYVTLADRLQILFSLCLPGLADRLLGSAFTWEA
jgi:short-subunit dehydrogenase